MIYIDNEGTVWATSRGILHLQQIVVEAASIEDALEKAREEHADESNSD